MQWDTDSPTLLPGHKNSCIRTDGTSDTRMWLGRHMQNHPDSITGKYGWTHPSTHHQHHLRDNGPRGVTDSPSGTHSSGPQHTPTPALSFLLRNHHYPHNAYFAYILSILCVLECQLQGNCDILFILFTTEPRIWCYTETIKKYSLNVQAQRTRNQGLCTTVIVELHPLDLSKCTVFTPDPRGRSPHTQTWVLQPSWCSGVLLSHHWPPKN